MTDELEQERRALASEIEHLRIQRDELAAKAERERIAEATDQRQADLGRSARGGEYGVDHAVASALERQRIADHTAEQDRHLAKINGSIADTAHALEDLVGQFATAAAQRVKETAVAQALADALKEQQEGGLTKKRLYISVVAIVLPMLLVLALTIFK